MSDEELEVETDLSSVQEDSEGFKKANRYSQLVGNISALFSTCVRSIGRADESPNDQELQSAWKNGTAFLLGVSPSLKTIFYGAAQALHPEELANVKPLTLRKLIGLFSLSEVSALLSVIYLYRRIRTKVDEKEWKLLEEWIHVEMELGAITGATIQHVGAGNGLLIGAIRPLAFALFSVDDVERFAKFRRNLKVHSLLYDLEGEKKVWGCNHLQIATHLVAHMGFQMPRSVASLAFALAATNVKEESYPEDVGEQAMCWTTTIKYVEGLHHRCKLPADIPEDHPLYMPPDEASKLCAQAEDIIGAAKGFDFVSMKSEEVPEAARQSLGIRLKNKQSDEDMEMSGEEEE